MSAVKSRFGVKDSTHQCRTIERDNSSLDHHRIVVTLLDKATRLTSREPLQLLPRTELQRVLAFLRSSDCHTCRECDPRTNPSEVIRDTISHALRDHYAEHYAWSPLAGARAPAPAPNPDDADPEPTPLHSYVCRTCHRAFTATDPHDDIDACERCRHEPKPEPKVDDAPPSPERDAFAQLVHSIATDAAREVVADAPTPGMDVDAVSALITDATAHLKVAPVFAIHVKDHEPREVDGKGKHAQFETVLRLVACGQNVFLVGPPGTGKTTLAAQVADALHGPGMYGAISCYATMPASALWGFLDAQGRNVETEFYRRYVTQGGVFLFDEIDNGHAGTLAAVNQALANGECAFPWGMQARNSKFGCIAAGNTYGNGATRAFMGRNALDKATKDRFKVVTVPIDEDLETALAHANNEDHAQVDSWITRVRRYRRNVESHGLEVVVSPRTTIDGSTMLAAGFTADECAEMTVLDGLSDDQRAKVTA